jgi:hypothetical protein
MDSWGSVVLTILVDGGTGSIPMPTYQSYGSVRHVPNSTIDVVQYTGTGLGEVTYSILVTSADYATLLAAFKAIPRVANTLIINPTDMGEWYIDSLDDAQAMLDGRVMCSITFRAMP